MYGGEKIMSIEKYHERVLKRINNASKIDTVGERVKIDDYLYIGKGCNTVIVQYKEVIAYEYEVGSEECMEIYDTMRKRIKHLNDSILEEL